MATCGGAANTSGVSSPISHGLILARPPRCVSPRNLGWGHHGSSVEAHIPAHSFWVLHAYTYSAGWDIAGASHRVSPGCFSLTPQGMPSAHRFEGPCSHFYVHFYVPTEGVPVTLPLLIDAGPRASEMLAWLEQARAVATQTPERADALLWQVLWTYAEVAKALPYCPPSTDLVDRACHSLEGHLGAPLRISNLAADLGVSPRHLNRLFQARYGVSITAWIDRRRADRLRRLLTCTDLPVAEVARQVGIRNHQHFNKVARRLLGVSPRALRRGIGPASD